MSSSVPKIEQKLGDWISNEILDNYTKIKPQEWLNKVCYGKPKKTPTYSVEQLEEKGYIGVYFNVNAVKEISTSLTEIPVPKTTPKDPDSQVVKETQSAEIIKEPLEHNVSLDVIPATKKRGRPPKVKVS